MNALSTVGQIEKLARLILESSENQEKEKNSRTFRIPAALDRGLEAAMERTGWNKTDLVVRAIGEGLTRTVDAILKEQEDAQANWAKIERAIY